MVFDVFYEEFCQTRCIEVYSTSEILRTLVRISEHVHSTFYAIPSETRVMHYTS